MLHSLANLFYRRFIPGKLKLLFRYAFYRLTGKLEREMLFTKSLNFGRGTFIDVGANYGIWSMYLSTEFAKVEAFEPNTQIIEGLRVLEKSNVNIHPFALGSNQYSALIYIPFIDGRHVHQRGSERKLSELDQEVSVEFRTMDSFNFVGVDLIKIDVEGSEHSVLIGAKETIIKNRPSLIIEIELRHNKEAHEVFNYLHNLDYSGFFLKNDRIQPLKNLSFAKNQTSHLSSPNSKDYINNFFFLPNESLEYYRQMISEW